VACFVLSPLAKKEASQLVSLKGLAPVMYQIRSRDWDFNVGGLGSCSLP